MTRQPWQKRPDDDRRLQGRPWQKLRACMLRDHPLCAMCEATGKVTEGSVLDHVIPRSKGGTDDASNLQVLCPACHDRKSLADRGFKPRRRIGADGFPIDE